MSLALAPLEGALRVRLDEAAWAGLVGTTEASPDTMLRPLPGTTPSSPGYDGALRESAALALGPAGLHLDVVTARGDRGLLGVIGSDGRSAASAVRVVATPAGASAVPVPGVEVSGFAAEHLADEVLRLVPPDGVTVPLADGEPTEVSVPEHLAIAVSRALRSGDEALAATAARECGYDEVPDLLRAASEQVRASATVTLAVAGSTRVEVHTWLQCRAGWLDLRVHGGTCTTRVVDRSGIHQDLAHALTGALDALYGVVDGG